MTIQAFQTHFEVKYGLLVSFVLPIVLPVFLGKTIDCS